MVVGNNGIDDKEKCRESAGDFDHYADAAVQCRVHRPMEHIPGFTRSHWPLDAAIGQVPAPYCPSGRHG